MKKLEDGLIDSKRILITSTCKTFSAKSTLTYQIGTEDDELHVRITKNTGGGFFSDEWISMNDIQSVLEEQPAGTPVTKRRVVGRVGSGQEFFCRTDPLWECPVCGGDLPFVTP